MSAVPPGSGVLRGGGEHWQRAHRFSHDAMATTFEILIAGREEAYARQAANEAFARCDQVESLLSRYRETSDVTRLNRAAVGESVLVGIETFACLEQAAQLHAWTQGTFDVTVGRWTDPEHPAARPPQTHAAFGLDLDAEGLCAARRRPDVAVDLGGIGKGFALDVMAEGLATWGVTRALIHGGGSTALALDGPAPGEAWPLSLHHPVETERLLRTVALRQAALSGSGQVRRAHIVDPHSGRLVRGRLAAWSLAPRGGWADGLSTAFMVMTPEDVAALCRQRPDLAGVLVSGTRERSTVATYGRWPEA